MKAKLVAVVLACAAASVAAQVSVSVGGAGCVNVNTGGADEVSVNTGKAASGARMNGAYVNPGTTSSSIKHSPGTRVTTSKDDDSEASGISVVNGNVTIDGVKVPPSATRWTGKDGTKYRIKRSGKGNVSVEEIDD